MLNIEVFGLQLLFNFGLRSIIPKLPKPQEAPKTTNFGPKLPYWPYKTGVGGAQWANLGPHVVKLNQYRYLMYFQPNFHVGILYEHCVCIFCICGFVFL